MSKKVVVLGESRDGKLRNVTFEAIAAAHQVADGGEVIGVLIGEDVKDLANELLYYGADHVMIVEHPHLSYYTSDGFAQALQAILDQVDPDAVLFTIRLSEKTCRRK